MWFTLATNDAWRGWQFFTALLLFFPSYLYLLIQKAAVDPEVKKDADPI